MMDALAADRCCVSNTCILRSEATPLFWYAGAPSQALRSNGHSPSCTLDACGHYFLEDINQATTATVVFASELLFQDGRELETREQVDQKKEALIYFGQLREVLAFQELVAYFKENCSEFFLQRANQGWRYTVSSPYGK